MNATWTRPSLGQPPQLAHLVPNGRSRGDRQYFINFGGISCDDGRVYVYMTVLMRENFQGWGSSSPPTTNSGFFMHMTRPEKGLAGMGAVTAN